MKTQNAFDRLQQITDEMSAISRMLVGTLKTNRKKIYHKDGSFSLGRETYTFQSTGGRKNRIWKRIPEKYVETVKQLIENGNRYRILEEEYEQISNLMGLEELKKKD